MYKFTITVTPLHDNKEESVRMILSGNKLEHYSVFKTKKVGGIPGEFVSLQYQGHALIDPLQALEQLSQKFDVKADVERPGFDKYEFVNGEPVYDEETGKDIAGRKEFSEMTKNNTNTKIDVATFYSLSPEHTGK